MRFRAVASLLELTARLGIACMFIYAALGKLDDSRAVSDAIGNYRLLPDSWTPILAVVLPTIELAIAAALISGLLARGASIVAFGMLALFAAAMSQAILRGIDLSCGCFGDESATVTWWTVGRNLALAALAITPLWTGITSWRRVTQYANGLRARLARRVERPPRA